MFNTTVVKAGSSTPYCREVHEHRAPTDQSVSLLREMEEKARHEVVSTIVGNSENEMHFKGAWFQESYMSGHVFRYVLTVNGKEITGEFRPDVPVTVARKSNAGVRKMLRHILDSIAMDVLESMVAF